MGSPIYDSDLNDAQWALLAPHIIKKKRRGPKSRVDLRAVVNAIFYRLRSGCQWRLLPKDYPAWPVVFGYWRRWQESGVWQRINTVLREEARVKAGRKAQPTAAIIDSRTVKTTQKGGSAGSTAAS